MFGRKLLLEKCLVENVGRKWVGDRLAQALQLVCLDGGALNNMKKFGREVRRIILSSELWFFVPTVIKLIPSTFLFASNAAKRRCWSLSQEAALVLQPAFPSQQALPLQQWCVEQYGNFCREVRRFVERFRREVRRIVLSSEPWFLVPTVARFNYCNPHSHDNKHPQEPALPLQLAFP